MPTNAEDKVKKLAKKQSNTVCPNCGCEKKFGFGSVCIKFHTFVCNECKSSHQAISHRCKSTTMSSWTDAEVAELEQKGNDYCRRTWLKNAPPEGVGGRPKPGMDINVYKRFVMTAYEHKKYYGEDEGPAQSAQMPTTRTPAFTAPVTTTRAVPPAARARQIKKPLPTRTAPTSVPSPQISDLLDFGASSVPAAPKSSSSNTDLFSTNFSSTTPTPAPAASGDMFSANFSTPVPAAPSSNGFPMLAKPNATAKPAPAPATGGFSLSSLGTTPATADSTLSDFAGLSVQPSSAGVKKPIMGSGGASAISMMGNTMQPMPQQQQRMHMGGPMQQMGMNPQMQQMGMNPQMQQQMNMNPQMQQQFMMMQQQQQQQQRMQMNGGGMNMMNNGGGMMMNNGGAAMGNGMSMNGGMGMNYGMSMNNGMSMGGGYTQQAQQQPKLSMNSMPGGDVMATMGMLNQKKK